MYLGLVYYLSPSQCFEIVTKYHSKIAVGYYPEGSSTLRC